MPRYYVDDNDRYPNYSIDRTNKPLGYAVGFKLVCSIPWWVVVANNVGGLLYNWAQSRIHTIANTQNYPESEE